MARFGESFLQQLGRPGWAQGMFGLGEAIGGVQGQLQQKRKEQKQLNRYDQIAQMSEQGYASAQSGDVASLTARIDQLQQARENAKTLEEKQAIGQSVLKLQGLLPGAEKASIGNNARELVNIDQSLQQPGLTETAKQTLRQKREDLMKDPRTVQQYQAYQMSQWNFEQAEDDVKAEQYLDENSQAINQAIQDNDSEALEKIVSNSGEYSEAVQGFIRSASENNRVLETLREKRIELTTAPDIETHTKAIEALPEELRNQVQPLLDAYTKVSKEGWNPKTGTWSEGSLINAKALQKKLTDTIFSLGNQSASNMYYSRLAEEKAVRKQIKQIELELEAPMSSEYLKQGRIMLQATLPRGEVPSLADIETQAKALFERDRNQLIQKLASLKGEEPVEEVEEEELEKGSFVVVGGENTTVAMFKESVSKLGEEETIRRLKKQGATEADINFLRGEKAPEPTEREKRMEAFGTRDERVSALGRGFVARTDALGTREERMRSLGSRAERMKALGSREERTSSLFN